MIQLPKSNFTTLKGHFYG